MAQTGTETQARAVACTLANSNIIKLFRVCIGIHAEGIYSHIASARCDRPRYSNSNVKNVIEMQS